MNIKKVSVYGSAILASCLLSTTASAIIGPPEGSCEIREERGSSAVFFVPTGSGPYNIMGWGNGTGGSVGSYDGMLEAAAEQCVIVAAATTSSSGNGRAVESAVNQAKSRYASKTGGNPKVCTSGHSQGGGGAFNAANRLNADCVIAVQPDTVYTTSISRPVSSSTDVVCIFTSGDTLAPASPFNASNCRRNSTRYSQERGSGTHFAPNSGTGGDPGRFQREYISKWLIN